MPAARKSSPVAYINEWGAVTPEDAIQEKLTSLAAGAADEYEERPLLILDQFEDVFKLDTDRLKLWECLADWLNPPDPQAHVLITMREEWLGAWGEASDYVPVGFESMIRLAPLSNPELLRAIEKPASVEGSIRFPDELANRILHDLKKPNAFGLGKEYVEPGLLQLVCQRLWNAASDNKVPAATTALYESMGGADKIIRDYVWNELRRAGSDAAYFSALDRVLWVGLTRHLSVVQGVKSIVSPAALARKIRIEDFGVAGPAVLDFELTRKQRGYLTVAPEKRKEDPPPALVHWIARVLKTGVVTGFLKQQQGTSAHEKLYELSHDALSPLLQEFAVEFEQWIRLRWLRAFYSLLGLVLLGPLFVLSWVFFGPLLTLVYSVIVVLIIAIYIGLAWVFGKLLMLCFETLAFPVLRFMCKGDPLRRGKRGEAT